VREVQENPMTPYVRDLLAKIEGRKQKHEKRGPKPVNAAKQRAKDKICKSCGGNAAPGRIVCWACYEQETTGSMLCNIVGCTKPAVPNLRYCQKCYNGVTRRMSLLRKQRNKKL